MLTSYEDEISESLQQGDINDFVNEFRSTSKNDVRRPRDSGYGTDDASPSRRVTYASDPEDSKYDLADNFGTMDLDNDVFGVLDDDCGNDRLGDFDNDSDAADREVEELLSHSLTLRAATPTSCCMGLNLHRPAAPVPLHADSESQCDDVTVDSRTPVSCSGTSALTICRQCRMHCFLPINSSDNDLTNSDNEVSPSAFTSRLDCTNSTTVFPRGNGSCRQRTRSECTRLSGPLPDVVSCHTDRPVSLPDIVALRQYQGQEMGKELRRIGDEFETFVREKRKRKVQTVSWNMFNCSLTFHLSGYLNTIRRFLSPGPQDTLEVR